MEQDGLSGDSYASGRFPIKSFAVSPLNQSEVLDDREGFLPTDEKWKLKKKLKNSNLWT